MNIQAGKINKRGELLVQRSDKLRRMPCPFAGFKANGEPCRFCGDWCIHFGAPEKVTNGAALYQLHEGQTRLILGCVPAGALVFESFEDEREAGA